MTADFATQIAEKQSAKEALTAEIASITANIDTLRADLKVKKAALKKAEKEVAMLEAKKAKADGYKRAEYLKKQNMFASFGEKVYWYPRNLPSDPEMIYLHNNIKIATGVYFCTHDIMELMFNDEPNCVNELRKSTQKERFERHKDKIEVYDNVFLGANAMLMGGVKVGPNAIVAANSVVTKDVPENSVVAGNPARVIGTYSNVLKRRIQENM